jgi:hypothetical protein
LKIKINYFKELNRTFIKQNNKELSKIDKINDILFTHRPTKENLQDHKILINDLLILINEKRDQLYILESDKRTLEKEINLWITDFDKLKYVDKLRDEIKKIDVEKIRANINEEMNHKV